MNALSQHAQDHLATLLEGFGLTATTLLSNWVDGGLVAGEGDVITLTNPATGETLVSYRDAGAGLIKRATQAAQRGQREWMALTASERGRRMNAAIRGLAGHEEALAQLESVVAGKPIRDCRAEVGKVREMFEYYAGWCDKQHGEVIPVPTSHLNYVRHVPYGVVGQITPWNAPMFTCAWQLAPAIAAGNGVVLKPSELTPFSSVVIAKLLESGLDWGIATEDLSIARHYRMTPKSISTGKGLPVDLDLELRFRDQNTALKVLKKPTQQAFLDGMINGDVRLVGDSADMNKLQKLLKYL